MREFVVGILYRVFLLALAVALIYMLPTIAHLLGDLMAAVFVPLLESLIQNMSNS